MNLVHKDKLIMSIPNDGIVNTRSKFAYAAKRKAMGLLKGAPDMLVLSKNNAIFLEFKKKQGKVSAAQRNVHNWLGENGHKCTVVRSLQEAIDAVNTMDG